MASNPSQYPQGSGAPQGYQPGVGAPVNQQHLQAQDGKGPVAPIDSASMPSHPNQDFQYQQAPAPPDYTAQTHHDSSLPAGVPFYPPPPSGGPPGNTTSQTQFPPPPQAGEHHPYPPQSSQAAEPGQQTTPYFPPPPTMSGGQQAPPPQAAADGFNPPLPPRRQSASFADDDLSNPIHYTRDPHKLIAYMVPFPKPLIKGVETAGVPDRFLIYTPPPPPLSAPPEGVKEDKLHKVQRKWQEEVRSAKTSDAKTASWKGVKSKATKGISFVMDRATSSSLDFVNRIPGGRPASPGPDKHHEDGVQEGDQTHKTVGLEEMILVYPSSFNATPDQVRLEFVNSMMRTKSKAQKDAVIATGLLPVSAAIDILATVVWPFGGLLEVDGVWAYSSIRGAKTARSVTKRLTSTGATHHDTEEQEMQGEKLQLKFLQSPRLEILYRYLSARCVERDAGSFKRLGPAPTETEVLSAIGWAPSQTGNSNKNWEDEQWETEEVKHDMKLTFTKAAKEWDRWCNAFAKDPEKALKK